MNAFDFITKLVELTQRLPAFHTDLIQSIPIVLKFRDIFSNILPDSNRIYKGRRSKQITYLKNKLTKMVNKLLNFQIEIILHFITLFKAQLANVRTHFRADIDQMVIEFSVLNTNRLF